MLAAQIRSNEFLRKLNEGFFRPRGLYCLVMSFDNTQETPLADEVLLHNASEASVAKTGVKKLTNKVRTHDGLSGPVDFPDAAPLIFPELDWLAKNGSDDQKNKISGYLKFRKFVADYYDRRAQAEYVSRYLPPAISADIVYSGIQTSDESAISYTFSGLCVKIRKSWRCHKPISAIPCNTWTGPLHPINVSRA